MSRANQRKRANQKKSRLAAFTPELRSWLRSALIDNLALKVVALVLAIGLFVVINTSEERVINVWHDVTYIQPSDRVLMSEPVAKVRLTIQGPWRRIRRFDERELAPIKVDLSDLQGGEYSFSQADIGLPKGLQLLAVDPPSIRLDYEPKVSKELTVVATPTGQPRAGFAVSSIVVEPDKIEVKGAESEMTKLDSLVALEINVTGRQQSFEIAGMPMHLPASVLESSHQSVLVRVTMEPVIVDRTIAAVPVVLKPADNAALAQLNERFQTEPDSVRVTLTGPQTTVEPLPGSALQAYVEVNASDLEGKGPHELEVHVREVPDDTRFEVDPKSVRLIPRPPHPPAQP